jgi:glycosyltransferase involved in cell wall biosynthesis
MNIAFNTLSENPSFPSGSLDWYRQMINGFGVYDSTNTYFIFVSKTNKYLFESNHRNIKLIKGGYSNENKLLRIFSEQFIIPLLLWWKKIDLFFTSSGGGVAPLIIPQNTKLIVGVFGTQHLRKDLTLGFFRSTYRKFFGILSLKRAIRIITNSNFCKTEILNFVDKDENIEEKIKIIYHGIDNSIFNDHPITNVDKKILLNYGINKPFFLFVSTIWFYKNVHTLLEAFGLYKKKYNIDCKLILIGNEKIEGLKKKSYKSELLKILQNYDIENDVVFLGQIKNELIPYFLKHAICYIQPSLYETFGKTVVEAFACGCPVIASDQASTPEIVDDCGLIFEATNPYDLEEKIELIQKESNLRDTLIEKGKDRFKVFTLEEELKNYINLFNEIKVYQKPLNRNITDRI